jgi:hypothetical protein
VVEGEDQQEDDPPAGGKIIWLRLKGLCHQFRIG